MWRGLEKGYRRALASLSIRFVTSRINYIFTVNTHILYLSCKKIYGKKSFNLMIKTKGNGDPIDTSIVFLVMGVA